MAKKPPSIAEQIRAALDGVFGKRRQLPRPKKSKRPTRVSARSRTYKNRAKRGAKVYVKPAPRRKTCGACGESGHNARRHARSAGAPMERDLGPVLDEPSLPDEAHVVAEVPSAPPAPPDPPAPPAEGDPAAGEVEAAGSVPEDVEGRGLAPAAEPELPPEVHASDTPRKRGPRRCKICGELGHDRRTCPGAGGDSAQEPNVEPPPAPAPSPPPPLNPAHEARIAEFRRLAAHFPALEPRARSVALLVAQGYDPGAIAGDLQIKRFDVYQLLDAAAARLRQAEIDHPTPVPVPPVLRQPVIIPAPATDDEPVETGKNYSKNYSEDFSPIPPISSQAHDEEPETTEEDAGTSSQTDPPRRTGTDRGKGQRTCRRCHQPGHNATTCDVDLTDARLQEIAAACVRLGLSAAPAPRAPMPVVETPVELEIERPTWDVEDVDAIAAMFPDLPEPPPPPPMPAEPEPERLVKVSDIKDRHRARTMKSPYRLTVAERRAGEQIEAPEDLQMPLKRSECQEDPGRPCPWVRCKAHLFLDVNEETGALKLNFPHLEVWEMAETCSNDVADRGPHTLEQVGALINVTRECVRQLEVGVGRNPAAKKIAEDIEFLDHDGESPLASVMG